MDTPNFILADFNMDDFLSHRVSDWDSSAISAAMKIIEYKPKVLMIEESIYWGLCNESEFRRYRGVGKDRSC